MHALIYAKKIVNNNSHLYLNISSNTLIINEMIMYCHLSHQLKLGFKAQLIS